MLLSSLQEHSWDPDSRPRSARSSHSIDPPGCICTPVPPKFQGSASSSTGMRWLIGYTLVVSPGLMRGTYVAQEYLSPFLQHPLAVSRLLR